MKTSEVLDKAADLIKERGWDHGGGWEGDGPLCLEGGIAAAMGVTGVDGIHLQCPAYHAVHDYLGKIPFVWNDAIYHERVMRGVTSREANLGTIQERAHAEGSARVLEVLRACAVIEAAREEQDAAWETYSELVTA